MTFICLVGIIWLKSRLLMRNLAALLLLSSHHASMVLGILHQVFGVTVPFKSTHDICHHIYVSVTVVL